ncbi:hypothetical protein C0993_005757 [Termitomyces sp. T159_Od127]|nr:hypothetical protein C0993_005757 [Termitomyces sp. T159_Od127]
MHGFKKMPHITSLCLKNDVGDDEGIVARVFNVAHLRKLSANRCIQVLPLLPHTLALVELLLTSVESTIAFWSAIGPLQALEILQMKHVTVGNGTSSHELDASSLPRLRHLLAPPSFSYIVANRFLSSVNLMDGVQTDQTKRITQLSSQILTTEVTENFTLSSSGLISLLIPIELCSIGGFSKKFPDLQDLTIMIGHPNFDFELQPNNFDGFACIKSCINEIATKWSPAPSVKSLEFKIEAIPSHNERKYLYDLELQYNLVYQTVPAFPNVRKVQFFDYLEWTRESCGDEWTGYIPFEFHSRIRSQLNDDHYVGKDVDGLLLPFLMFDTIE